ncbi:MAG TPA: hypothetical protein VJU85_05070 [Nitrososphaeraceae archaeon]|nr:hypothetical protein [Nitrososphaeraceae archaeon]
MKEELIVKIGKEMTKTKIMSENDELSLENTTIIIFDKSIV